MEYVVALVAFGLGVGAGRLTLKRPVPPEVVTPAVAAAPALVVDVPRPVLTKSGTPDGAWPERFTLYVDGQPVKGAEDWRDIRDFWRVAGPTRLVWDREQASWR